MLHVIVNPASGNGRGERRWKKVERELMEFGFNATVRFTSGPGDATSIARAYKSDGAEYVVAVGGDGTVNEVINGLLDDDGHAVSDVRLAVIPCGTGSDLCRSTGITRPATALRAIELDAHACVDIGKITFRDGETGESVTRLFVNVADVGLGAQVAERSNNSSKALGGMASYLVNAVRTIAVVEPTHSRVTIDNTNVFDGDALMIVFANGRYHAGGMDMAPTSSLRDGLLDILILEGVGRRELLTGLLPRVYLGKHVGRRGVHHFRARCAEVETATPVSLEMDGEPVGSSPLKVEVVPKALRLIAAGSVLR